jgi:hypothetical protein
MPNATPTPTQIVIQKIGAVIIPKPKFFVKLVICLARVRKGEKKTLKLECLIFSLKKWRTKNCMQWVLGSALVPSPVIIEGQFPALVLVADWFPFLISSSEFVFPKFKTHDPGTQLLEPANSNHFLVHKEHPITGVMFHISIVQIVY